MVEDNIEQCKPEVEKIWNEFWKEIVCKPDGSIDISQLKKELADFSMVMNGASKVYCAITDDRISKLNTDPDVVIRVAEDLETERTQEAVKDEIDALKAKGVHVDGPASFTSVGVRHTLSNSDNTGTYVFIPD